MYKLKTGSGVRKFGSLEAAADWMSEHDTNGRGLEGMSPDETLRFWELLRKASERTQWRRARRRDIRALQAEARDNPDTAAQLREQIRAYEQELQEEFEQRKAAGLIPERG